MRDGPALAAGPRSAERARLAQRFGEIYLSNHWQSAESGSGPGSTKTATVELIPQIIQLMQRLGVRILVDAPCGDANWIQPIALHATIYAGYDVVPWVVDALGPRARDFGPNAQFAAADITADQLPKADLILCRDCLVHLTDELVMTALAHLAASRSTWLLATTFPDLEQNTPGAVGGWRPIDLTKPPFNLPPPQELIFERPSAPPNPNFGRKALGLWKLSEIRVLLPEVQTPDAVLMLRPPSDVEADELDSQLRSAAADGPAPLDAGAAQGLVPAPPAYADWLSVTADPNEWSIVWTMQLSRGPDAYVEVKANTTSSQPMEIQLLRRTKGADKGPFAWQSLHKDVLTSGVWVVHLDWLYPVEGFEPQDDDYLQIRINPDGAAPVDVRLCARMLTPKEMAARKPKTDR
jgi:hypothetical protein